MRCITHFIFYRFEEAAASFREMQEIFRLLLTKKISSSAPVNAELLHLVVSLLFHGSAKVEVVAVNHIECVPEAEQLISKMWQELAKLIEENWITSYFSPKFGAPGDKKFNNADNDIQVQYFRPNSMAPVDQYLEV